MATKVKVTFDPIRLGRNLNLRLLGSDKLAANMFVRGLLVEGRAKQNLSRPPRRIDTGLLRASIHTSRIVVGGLPGAQVGSPLKYAWYVHDGTGLYGPKRVKITPKVKKFLRFRPKNSRTFVFARSVKGMKPNPYLVDALPAARL